MLPDLIIIGAMKSGTSSLHSYPDLHPHISMSYPKERDFFGVEKNWSKGRQWYESKFADGDQLRIQGFSNVCTGPTLKKRTNRIGGYYQRFQVKGSPSHSCLSRWPHRLVLQAGVVRGATAKIDG